MSERVEMLEALQREAQALADKVRAVPDAGCGYDDEAKALVYGSNRAQEVAFFLRDAAKAARERGGFTPYAGDGPGVIAPATFDSKA